MEYPTNFNPSDWDDAVADAVHNAVRDGVRDAVDGAVRDVCWRAITTLERVEKMCQRWERSETWDGQIDLVGRAFAHELREALSTTKQLDDKGLENV